MSSLPPRPPQGVLLGDLRRSPRPLGTLACLLTALRGEVEARDRDRTASTLELRAALRQLTELQTHLLEAVAESARSCCASDSTSSSMNKVRILGGVREAGEQGGVRSAGGQLAWLQGVLDPPQQGRGRAGGHAGGRGKVLWEHSPLRVAFEDRDYSFMASAVMEGYTRQKWWVAVRGWC